MSQVGLQSVVVTLSLSAARTCAFFQFAAEDGLWQSVITHAQHVARPAKLSRNQECLDARYVTNLEHLSVWLLVLLSDMCQVPKATHVELL